MTGSQDYLFLARGRERETLITAKCTQAGCTIHSCNANGDLDRKSIPSLVLPGRNMTTVAEGVRF